MRYRMFPVLLVAALFVVAGCGMSPVDDGDAGNGSSGTFTVYTTSDGLIANAVNDVAVDLYRAGVWVATPAGISFYSMSDSSWTSYGAASGLPSLEVNAVAVHLGTVWAGTASGPASLADSTWKELSNASSFPNLCITAITAAADPDYSLWFGTLGGVVRRSMVGGLTSYTTLNGLAANDVSAIVYASGGDVWVGTSSSLSVFDGTSWTFPSMPLSSVFIQSVYGDTSGSVWVGTSGGIMAFTGDTSRSYGTSDGLPSVSVNDFAEDSAHILWAAADGGVAWLDSTVWRELSLPDEVSGYRVTSLAADALTGSLWIGTSGGLVRYHPE